VLGNKIFPYLLRKLPVTRPNQVWAMDITYIPMARGFVYLTAVVDWFSRKVLAWRLSITMDVAFCVEAVEDAMARFGKPEIFNTDQGSQFTSREFTTLLIGAGIKISMDGKGAWRDNVFVERIWKSVKYEEVYPHAPTPACPRRAPRSVGIWPSTTAGGPIRVWDGKRPIRPTSMRCSQSRLRHNKGRNPLSDSPETVQTNRASSLLRRTTTHMARASRRVLMIAVSLPRPVRGIIDLPPPLGFTVSPRSRSIVRVFRSGIESALAY